MVAFGSDWIIIIGIVAIFVLFFGVKAIKKTKEVALTGVEEAVKFKHDLKDVIRKTEESYTTSKKDIEDSVALKDMKIELEKTNVIDSNAKKV
jgi:peroxiredoxin family protein